MADTAGNTGANCLERLENYARTTKGAILVAEILISIIILICYAVSSFTGYTTVAIVEMVFAIIFFIVFMMDLDKSVSVLYWVWSDLIRAITGGALYLITSLLSLTKEWKDDAMIAGGVIGLLAGLLFAYDAYTVFLVIKRTRQHTAAPTSNGI